MILQDQTLQQELLNRLDMLANTLGTTVEHLWPILVRQQHINGWIHLGLWAPFCLVLAGGAALLLRHTIKRDRFNGPDSEGWFIANLLFGIAGATGLIALPFVVHFGITRLANPEFYALMALRGFFGG